jgi:signal transduction histidine kinase
VAHVRLSLPTEERTRIAIYIAATNVTLFALMSLAAWAAWGGLQSAIAASLGALAVVGEGLAVTLVNLVYGVVVIAGSFAFRPMSHGWAARVLIATGVSAVASVPRVLALVAIGSTPTSGFYIAAAGAIGLAAGVVAVTSAILAATLIDRARTEERRREEQESRARKAVEELQNEEMRVRRMVSDQLHGNLQYRMVVVTAGLDGMADQLAAAGDAARAKDLRAWAETLEEIREEEVRSLSHAVFPAGADLSTAAAIEVLLRRLPPNVTTKIELGPVYRRWVDAQVAPMPIPERLVAVYTAEEAITNALKHGGARSIRIFADARPTSEPDRWIFEVTVDDDGTGLADPIPRFNGLERHRQRIENRGGRFELTASPEGGARLHFTLPFDRVAGGVSGPTEG